MIDVKGYELTIWQAKNGFVIRIGNSQGNFIAKDKHELASLITSFKYENEQNKDN